MAYDTHPELRPAPFGTERNARPIEFTPRFDHVIRFLDEKGGTYQRARAPFAQELDVTPYCLRRVLERAKDLGLIRIIATAHPTVGFGGRFPSTYELMIPFTEWIERRDDIVGVEREKRRRAKSQTRKRDQTVRRRITTSTMAEAASARDRAQERRATEAPPIPFGSPAAIGNVLDSGFDVDAWANAVDFDDEP